MLTDEQLGAMEGLVGRLRETRPRYDQNTGKHMYDVFENRDGDEAADALTTLIAAAREGVRLREALKAARSVLANSGAESGYCMCGEPVLAHSIGSGHAPVDSHVYCASQTIEQIDAALNEGEK